MLSMTTNFQPCPRILSPEITGSRKVVRNAERVIQLESAMFNWRSRHLILVLTLSYCREFQHLVNLETIRLHRDQLLNNRRSNKLLAGINGYVWKIEEGHNGAGLHMHLILFYAGEHRADCYLTRSIGEYWVNVVTQGAGSYWNSNADKAFHEMHGHGIGTGQIDRHDPVKREALRKNLLYLAKEEQEVVKGANSHLRMFGTSAFPD